MQVNITARHLDLTPALKEYAEKKLLKTKKYSNKITNVHIILNVEKNRHIAEIVLHVSGQDISAKAMAGDMYGAIDLVMNKILKQLKRHMAKVKDHRKSLPYSVVADLAWEEIQNSSTGSWPLLNEVRKIEIKRQSVPDAVKYLRDRDLKFWVFREKGTDNLNIVYRKDGGSYGMMIIKGKEEDEN